MQIMEDILNTHRVFIFGAFNCTLYTLDEFKNDVQTAERDILGITLCSSCLSDGRISGGVTLFPSYLIQDDLFQVFAHIFAASDGVDRMLKCKDNGVGMDVFCCVIPENVVSLYDHEAFCEYSIGDIDEWVDGKSVDIFLINGNR